jgi:hypothetical protein
MPSVLDQTFRHTLLLDERHRRDIEHYCETEIGGRTYYLHHCRGGKHWHMTNLHRNTYQIEVCVDDDHHATILALRFS